MLNAAVSGSFHRHMGAITAAVHELASMGVRVLSPADPRVVAAQGEFLFVASDRVRSVRLVQDRHLESIRAANFLWLVCPDGYVGQSASMEVGFAAAARVPIFATRSPLDLTLREYVSVVPSLSDAVDRAVRAPHSQPVPGILIDPNATVERAHAILEGMCADLNRAKAFLEVAPRVHRDVAELQASLALPTRMH